MLKQKNVTFRKPKKQLRDYSDLILSNALVNNSKRSILSSKSNMNQHYVKKLPSHIDKLIVKQYKLSQTKEN